MGVCAHFHNYVFATSWYDYSSLFTSSNVTQLKRWTIITQHRRGGRIVSSKLSNRFFTNDDWAITTGGSCSFIYVIYQGRTNDTTGGSELEFRLFPWCAWKTKVPHNHNHSISNVPVSGSPFATVVTSSVVVSTVVVVMADLEHFSS